MQCVALPACMPAKLHSDLTVLFYIPVAQLFRRIMPKVKLIAILREPVSRSLSRFIEQYNWPFHSVGLLEKVGVTGVHLAPCITCCDTGNGNLRALVSQHYGARTWMLAPLHHRR